MLDKNFKKEVLIIAIKAAIEAGEEILNIYNSNNIGVNYKSDNSPLTLADKRANAVIVSYLQKTKIPVVSEEEKLINYSERINWSSYWIVDPLDGTKEFINKNGEFTVNIALAEGQETSLGVIYCPVSRELYYTDQLKSKAYKTIINTTINNNTLFFNQNDEITPSLPKDDTLRVVCSRSHLNEDTKKFIDEMKERYKNIVLISRGSSLKFCMVAEGIADVYPRFAPTMEWDTAAGQAICEAVGINVWDQNTKKPLLYNKKSLKNNWFLVK